MPLKKKFTADRVKDLTDDQLDATEKAIHAHRTSDEEAATLDAIHAERRRRRDAADSKRIAKLLDLLAEHIMSKTPSGSLTFGEGVNAHEIHDDDFYRAAELLDPSINE